MSSYGSSYLDRSRTPSTYGSLPRTYGSARTSADCRSPTRADSSSGSSRVYGSGSSNYGSATTGRYTPRGYTSAVDRAPSERPKSPERAKYTPLETSVLRMGSSSRFGGQIARSPISDKTPNVFGVSPVAEASPTPFGSGQTPSEPVQVTLVTRSTSPTPPCNSSFLRAKRADMDRLDIQTISRIHYRPVHVTSETQTDDGKKPTAWGSRTSGNSSSSSSSSAAARGYRGYIRPGDLPTKKEEPPERKDVVSRVGGLSLSRPTDLPLSKTTSYMRNSESRSPSYRDVQSSTNSLSDLSVKTAESKSPVHTPDDGKPGFRHLLNSPKETSTRSTFHVKPPDPPMRSSSKLDLKPPVNKTDSSSSSKLDVQKSSSKSSIASKKPAAPVNQLKKSTTTLGVACPPSVPNKDFRKSILNMDLSKKQEPSSSSETSSSGETESSSEDSSAEDAEEAKSDLKYHTASRTTAQMSSADEVSSLSLDKPPIPWMKKDEPKAVIVKTTSTATPMKVKYGNSASSNSPADKEDKKQFPLRRFDSGQKDWWLSSESDEQAKASNGEVSGSDPQLKSEQSEKKMFKLRKFDSGQMDWWKSTKDVPSLSNSENAEEPVDAKVDTSSSSYKKLPRVPSSASIPKSGVSLQNIPSSVSLDTLDKPPVNLNKTPSSSSLKSSPSSVSLPKNSTEDLQPSKTTSASSLPLDDEKNALKKPLTRTRSSASLQKSPSGAALQRTASNASLSRVPGNLAKSGSNGSVQKSGSGVSLQKTGSGANLLKTGSSTNLSKSDAGGGLLRAPSNTNLAKTPSSTNLAAKPPINVNLIKTDNQEVLEAKEHTPAFYRLHKRYGMADAARKKIVRVESGERDWWLADEEKAEQIKARPSEVLGKVYCGLFTDVDQVLGTQAPPPAAFRTPGNSSDEDSSDDEFWQEVKPSDVKVHEPIVQPEGMIKVEIYRWIQFRLRLTPPTRNPVFNFAADPVRLHLRKRADVPAIGFTLGPPGGTRKSWGDSPVRPVHRCGDYWDNARERERTMSHVRERARRYEAGGKDSSARSHEEVFIRSVRRCRPLASDLRLDA
ncbi:Hypothetical protein NTJ_16306 [Nesidiocoris tenuis]|nr:Hypothetical protein NTJ_16306 [Nesidiocoris tenuis]